MGKNGGAIRKMNMAVVVVVREEAGGRLLPERLWVEAG